jgi:hypothetical protein
MNVFESEKVMKFVHILLGGAIGFFLIYMIMNFSLIIFDRGLDYFNALGIQIFNETRYALLLFMFGLSYLPGGFLGGIYTSYQLRDFLEKKSELKYYLILPGVIAFLILIVVRFVFGYLDFTTLLIPDDIIVPLIGSLIGVYLGGFSLNWPDEN